MRRAPLAAGLVLAALLACTPPARAQGFNTFNGRNHPELRWREARTPHFTIVYPDRIAGIEAEAAAIAESTYAALSATLGVTFDERVRIYLSDEDEIVNGFASPIGGYTAIWVRQNGSAETFTGSAKWLRKVLAHELAHLFHYRATRSNLGLLGYAFSNPTPRFWTEGLAQYLTERWDSERGERWLRTAAIEHRLAFDDGESVWNGRLLYAVGNAQVRFFAHQYGDTTLARLLAYRRPVLLGLGRVHNLYEAFSEVTGEPYERFYDRWLRHVTTEAGARAAGFEMPESLGVRIEPPGQVLYGFQPGPDTARVAVVRLPSLGRPVRQLIVLGRRERVVAEGAVEAPVAWRPDGQALAFAQTGRAAHGALVADLYLADVGSGRTRRLTRGRRASSPTFAPDGRRVAFVGARGGPGNVFVLDTESGAETALTRFTGDVQIQGLAWRPSAGAGAGANGSGADEIAVALFDSSGVRALHLLDVRTGALRRLTDGRHDDRSPVWRPDGAALAYTSLRDGVPNVFVLDVATGATARVTAAPQGATAHGWLPPDSAHADGRLALISGVSKTQDEVFLADASRRRGEPLALVPDALSAWERRMPTRPIAERIAPAPSLVERRSPYRALAHLNHVVTLPFPYVSGGQVGAGAFTLWLEPLGKHALVAATGIAPGRLRRESFFTATYRNATLAPTLDLSVYRFPGSARLYGPDVLVERLTGADLRATLPLGLGRTPYTTASVAALARIDRSDPLNADDFADLAARDAALRLPQAGTQASLTLALSRRAQRPFVDAAIHPLDGYGLRAALTGGAGLDRRTAYARADVAAYAVLPGLGPQRLFVYGRAQGQAGQSLPQDYLGLSRYDDLQVSLPAFVPVAFDRNERVRGYRQYAVGQAVLFGSVEYRMPFVPLNTSVLGVVSLGSTALTLFADGAVVGHDLALRDAVRRTGVGVELKNVIRIAGQGFGHALGFAQQTRAFGFDEPYEVYYRIRLGVPF